MKPNRVVTVTARLAFLGGALPGMRTTCSSLAAASPPAPPTVQLESEACWLTSATIEVLLRHNQISSMSVEAAMVAAIDSAYRKLPHAFGQMTPQRIMGLPVAQAVPISLIPLPLSAAPLLQTTKAMPPLPSPPLSPPISVPTAAASRSPFKRRRTSPSDDDLTPLTAEERYRARLLLAEKEGRLPKYVVARILGGAGASHRGHSPTTAPPALGLSRMH